MDGQQLKQDFDAVREQMPEHHRIRLHRAISWYQCAERYAEADADLCFIALWVGLNSCYAASNAQEHEERAEFKRFANMLVPLDQQQQIYNCLWKNYAQFVKALINNQYVFPPFWKSQVDGNQDWEKKFEGSRKAAERALAGGETATLLSIVFDRLYVLRNQMLHGGATYQSGKNRDQVTNGKRMLMELLPIVIRLMFDHAQDWGPIHYPPLDTDQG